jgi:uncharacterized protein YegL
MKLSIQLLLEKEPPQKKQTSSYAKPSIEEKVKDAICMCESGHDSKEDWEFLRKVNNALMKLPNLNSRQKNLLKMITPVLRKHSSASGGKIELDSEKLADAGALFNYEDK